MILLVFLHRCKTKPRTWRKSSRLRWDETTLRACGPCKLLLRHRFKKCEMGTSYDKRERFKKSLQGFDETT